MLPKRLLATCVVLCTVLGLAGSCGTILYPERRGGGGRVDVGVAVMDGLWLLAFIVPGVVFYIVDFSDGAIYRDGGYYRRR